MKCKNLPSFLTRRPSRIEDIWEVRLPKTLALQLKRVARQRKVTLSQISRYCIFRIAERENLAGKKYFKTALEQSRRSTKESPTHHRHLVCFYGEDVKLVRLAALNWGISVSALIRLALWIYLPCLVMAIHNKHYVSPNELFWRGIKRWLVIPLKSLNTCNLPTERRYLFSGFPPTHWWPQQQVAA